MSVRMRGFASYIRLSDALKVVLSNVKQLGSEVVPFDRALNRALAEDIFSKVDVPPFDRSAVDGYAVQAADTFGASELKPAKLHVVGSADIGAATKLSVRRGEAVKIMTGAPMPKGADAAVMVEHTRVEGSRIAVLAPVTPGKNVSARGEDVKAGEVVLERGWQLRPQDIGMLASTGNVRVRVARRPRVAILATGSELREPGTRLKRAEIADINSYSLAAAVASCGGLPRRLGIVPDGPELLKRALLRAIKHDVVLISGGSSVGERDIVPNAVAELGEVLLHGVAIRPGGPTAFGIVKGKPVFALAGFPVSALVAFDMIARPALRRMQGLPADRGYPSILARLTRKVSSTLGRIEVVRVHVRREAGELMADPIRIAGSGILSSMTKANGFVIVPEDVEGFNGGSIVEVELYR
ncbi:MAG: molybdopterin molybdotransferase MoeA [Candidatus Hodarchaeaceae archaeon]|nr:molybdopterin molybdotransferase MoeA [Candidatus Hodarchaeaceae archaeon]